jgi:hypothetical protein
MQSSTMTMGVFPLSVQNDELRWIIADDFRVLIAINVICVIIARQVVVFVMRASSVEFS